MATLRPNGPARSRVAWLAIAAAATFAGADVLAASAANGGSAARTQPPPAASAIVERYDRAARFGAWNADRLLRNADVRPQWSRAGAMLWYGVDGPHGREFVVRRARDGRVVSTIPSGKLLAAFAARTGLAPAWPALLAAAPELSNDGASLDLTAAEKRWRCRLAALTCEPLAGAGPTGRDAVSPDGRWAVFVREHDLWVRDLRTGAERALTTDGIPDRAWARPTDRAAGVLAGLPIPEDLPPAVIWSPDSRRLLTVRVDQSALRPFPVVEQVPHDSLLPRVHAFRYGFAVEPEEAHEELHVVDVVAGTVTKVRIDTEPLGFDSTIFMRRAWWSADGRRLAIAIVPQAEHWADVYRVDPATGEARRLFRDDSVRKVLLSGELQHPPSVALLANGDVVWYSTRDGFGHLYLVDGESGRVRHALTPGPRAVHRVLYVDERRGWIYYAAGGDTYGPEPYFSGVWRARLDGSRQVLLTPEQADHQVGTQYIGLGAPAPATTSGFAPGGERFVDSYSTPLQPEITVLRAADGRMIAELARAELASEIASRYRPPERFVVPAPAGREALHGMLLFPSDFDPAKRYPVIDAIYNGSQVVEHARRFTRTVFGEAQSLAELGFVVLVTDARGTPLRSREFHEFAFDDPAQVAMIGDHVHVLRELAKTRPWMDLDRVGLTGTSNGGYAALRAMLAHPEVFKVAVSCNGSHDMRKYMVAASGAVRRPGVDPMAALADRDNAAHVAALRGRLLLIVGGFDANVPIANTYGVAQALIDAGKDFDLVVAPRMGHDMSFDRFAVKKQWDHVVRHLQGETPPGDYRMPEFAAPDASANVAP